MRYCIFLLVCSAMTAATVDRLAVTVGVTVITELQIDEELRVAALLNGQPVSRDIDARRAAADRLIEQLLIAHEIDISRYPGPSGEEVTAWYAHVEQSLGGADRLKELMDKYHIFEETLRLHLLAQLATLRFIDFRFRPDISISDSEIENAYHRQAVQLSQPPPLDANERAKLSAILVEERTDAALNSWLAESRKQVNIKYVDPSLQ
jgi:hypothetical protein